MGGPHSSDFIETVRQAADIVRVISDYVPLKQAGVRYKGLCPFHQEKTPSFSVDSNNQLFYCFGCQTGGDVFKFIQLYEKTDFREALESLAQRFGVPIPRAQRPRDDDPRERTLAINDAAQEFFREQLGSDAGKRCREYLAQRGLDDETIAGLGLGYAPDDWERMRSHLVARRFSPAELQKAGMTLPRKSGRGEYDRFRDRLIFPIRDVSGRTVAFGGRALGDTEPKYINSPETPAYTKGNHLYGLNRARDSIRREGHVIVVEGYMDVAALAQAGFDNVVAALGTAFTPAQARLLKRCSRRAFFSYDGDAAGAAATVRSLDLLLEEGFEVRVVELPSGTDPDDHIRKEGADDYRRLVQEAPEYLEFLVHRQIRERDILTVQGKVAAVNEVLPHVCKLSNPIERASWADRLADALQIEEGLVLQELRSALRNAQTTIRQRPSSSQALHEAEIRLVALLMGSEEERVRLGEELDETDLETTRIAPIVQAILRLTREEKEVDHPTVLAELGEGPDAELLTRIAFEKQPENGPGLDDCLWAFRVQRLRRQERRAVRELGKLQKSTDDQPADEADVNRRLTQLQELARQRDSLHR